MIKDMNRRGFTITELLIVIVVMGILLTLGVVGLRGSQLSSRDSERKSDIEALALHLESYYTSGTDTTGAPSSECTGGTITHSGGYTIHTFNANDTLVCTNNFNANVLLVGGGGAGGLGLGTSAYGGGGGGAGQVISLNSIVVNGSMGVVVGLGGASASASGSSSSFASNTAVGGGGGGRYSLAGNSGASGGGAGGSTSGTLSGGTATFGFRGGNSCTDNSGHGGGGGGAGAIGQDAGVAGATGGGTGGEGVQNSISGASLWYAQGGEAGYGKRITTHGGGLGAQTGVAATAGAANTGSGGGGGYNTNPTQGNGGSGVVIVRYPTLTIGTYPSTALTATAASMVQMLRDIDTKSISAPGITDPTLTLIPATNTIQTTAGILPQPAFNQYVYQPLKSDGSLCTNNAQECVEFNLYYRLETDNNVYIVTSRHQ